MRVVPIKEVHPELWKGANRKFARVPWRKIEVERHNAERTPEQQARRTSLCVSLCLSCCQPACSTSQYSTLVYAPICYAH